MFNDKCLLHHLMHLNLKRLQVHSDLLKLLVFYSMFFFYILQSRVEHLQQELKSFGSIKVRVTNFVTCLASSIFFVEAEK